MRANTIDLQPKKLTWEHNKKTDTYYLHCGGFVTKYSLKNSPDLKERMKVLENDFLTDLKAKSDYVLKFSVSVCNKYS